VVRRMNPRKEHEIPLSRQPLAVRPFPAASLSKKFYEPMACGSFLDPPPFTLFPSFLSLQRLSMFPSLQRLKTPVREIYLDLLAFSVLTRSV